MSRKTTILEVKSISGAPVTVAPDGPCKRCKGEINSSASKIAVVTVNPACAAEITLKWGFFCSDCSNQVSEFIQTGFDPYKKGNWFDGFTKNIKRLYLRIKNVKTYHR